MKQLIAVLAMAAGVAHAQTPSEIPYESVPDFFKLPADMNFGETAGVAVNSKVTCLCSRVAM